jgi:hypothetical protein
MPELRMDNLLTLQSWLDRVNKTSTAWTAVSLAVDVAVCAISRFFPPSSDGSDDYALALEGSISGD